MIAYITTFFPAPSHTFIAREVEALRARGVEISTTSVRRAPPETILSEEDQAAFETTDALVPARWSSVLGAHLAALLRHPPAYAATLRVALAQGRPGWRGRLWQLFYFGEAIMAWRRWRARGVRHIHAHFAAVPADVAMLASEFGRIAGTGPASWSFTMHGPTELHDVSWFGLAEKVQHANAVVCISDFARSQLMALVDEQQWEKLRVIHCGVAPARYARIAERTSTGARILCVGRLVPEKGHAMLLNALARLKQRGIDAELELVGDGPARQGLENLVGELGLEDRVHFAGATAQHAIDAHYEAARVFCLPSFSEGVPMVLMEAMAGGRPVVATAVAGVRELVRHGESGLLVSPGRPDELAHALEALLGDPDLCRRLGQAGRRHISERYDIDRSAAELDELFAELVGGLGRGGPSRAADVSAPRPNSDATAPVPTAGPSQQRTPIGARS